MIKCGVNSPKHLNNSTHAMAQCPPPSIPTCYDVVVSFPRPQLVLVLPALPITTLAQLTPKERGHTNFVTSRHL